MFYNELLNLLRGGGVKPRLTVKCLDLPGSDVHDWPT